MSDVARAPVSAVVLTLNEELNLPACLASVVPWCAEVFVVDSGSTDGTRAVAESYGAAFVEHEFVDHPSQWEWVLRELPLTTEWVLALDADHVVTPALAQEAAAAVAAAPANVDGFYCRHVQLFRGRRIRGLKSRWLHLVRRDRTSVDSSELVDARFVVTGETRALSGAVVEDNAHERAWEFWKAKHERYADRLAAEEVLRRAGRRSRLVAPRFFGNDDERVVWLKERWYRLPLYVRPFLYFLYRYLVRGGFLDGRVGLQYHVRHAFVFRLAIDRRIAALRRRIASGELSLDDLERGRVG